MFKLFKWLLKLFLGLLLLLSIAVLVLPWVIDQQQVKDQISQQFERRTGHSLNIAGPIDWSVFPWLGLRLQQVRVGNAPGFSGESLADMRYLDLKMGLKPLLEKKVVVDTVVLKGVTLNLLRNAQGKGNWESLMGKTDSTDGNQQASSDKSSIVEAFEVSLKGFVLEDVNLHWQDQAQGQAVDLQGINIKLGELIPNKPVPVNVALNFKNVHTQPAVEAQIEAGAELTYSKSYQSIELNGFNLELKAQGDGLPESGIEMALAGDIRMDREQDVVAMSDFSMSLLDLKLTGDMSVKALSTAPVTEARLHLQKTNLKALLATLGHPLETADPAALTAVSGEWFMRQQGQSLLIKPLQLKLDDSELQGQLDVQNFQGPVVRAQWVLDQINLDRYLPPTKDQPPAEAVPAGSAKAAQPSFEALRTLDLNAQLNIGRLTINKVSMHNMELNIRAQKGVISLNKMLADLYQGKLTANARLDVRKAAPAFQINKQLTQIAIGPLLQDLVGEDRLTGTGNVKVNLAGRGLDADVIKRSLNGDVAIEFRDGSYKGINLAQSIRQAWATIQNKQFVATEPLETDFAELRASAKINNGVIDNQDLFMSSPIFRLNGKGKVDLPAHQLDYLLTVKVVGSLEGQGGKPDERLMGVALPVRLAGVLDKPSVSVDIATALKANAKGQLKDKAMEKIEEKLGPGGVMDSLFGR